MPSSLRLLLPSLALLVAAAPVVDAFVSVTTPASLSSSALTPSISTRRVRSVIRLVGDADDAEDDTAAQALGLPARPGRSLKVAIAGGGVGGLTAALAMLQKGFDVTVYEKTAAFARFGGPIQFASNALSVLQEMDPTTFERVMAKFTFTGTRTCGIKDGLRADGSFRMTGDSLDYLWNPKAPADWFVKFPLKVGRTARREWQQLCVWCVTGVDAEIHILRGRHDACPPNRHVSHDCMLSFPLHVPIWYLLLFASLVLSSNARTSLVCPTRASLTARTCKKFSWTNVAKSSPTLFKTAMA
jgi:hypothetical protein